MVHLFEPQPNVSPKFSANVSAIPGIPPPSSAVTPNPKARRQDWVAGPLHSAKPGWRGPCRTSRYACHGDEHLCSRCVNQVRACSAWHQSTKVETGQSKKRILKRNTSIFWTQKKRQLDDALRLVEPMPPAETHHSYPGPADSGLRANIT